MVERAEELRLLSAHRQARGAEHSGAPQRHIDVPASLATEEELLGRAGFTAFRLWWREGEAAIDSVIAPA
jgi:hypothetical protein